MKRITDQSPNFRPLRIVEIVSSAVTVEAFLGGHLTHLKRRGFEVTVVASPSDRLSQAAAKAGVLAVAINIPREMSPLKDLLALMRLCLLFRRLKPQVVNAGTPKAGFLGMLAARISGVPVRIYTLRGLRLETSHGWKRRVLCWTEQTAAYCAQSVVAVSPSLGRAYLQAGFCSPEKLHDGIVSSHGVDSNRFAPRRDAPEVLALRQQLGFEANDPVIGFVGRLTRDKGIGELLTAFRMVIDRIPAARLLILGEFENGDPISNDIRLELESNPRIRLAGSVRETELYYNAMDVFAFPSYREGLPNAPLEAAATEVPTVGFAATGTVDAIVDGHTGWLVPVGDISALAERLIHALQHPVERRALGRAARSRVQRDFAPQEIYNRFERLYRELLLARGISSPAELDSPAAIPTAA